MRALFSTAASTIAWLGESDGNSDLVYYAILLSAPRQSLGLNNFGTRRALRDLLNRKYWSRVWVIQEFLLPVKLDVWWGRCRVKASDLHQLVWAMTGFSSRSKPQDYHVWNTPGRVLLLYRTNYQTMCRFEKHDYCKEFADAMTLQSLLRSFSSSQCTLIHDRVYALLGIASDVIYSSDPISPDYTKSPTELFLDVLRSQYGSQIPGVKRAWSSIDLYCSVLGLTRREIEQSTYVRAQKVKRESFILDVGNRRSMFGGLWSSTFTLTSRLFCPRRSLKLTILAMGQEPGCLVALEDYLDYSKSHKELVQGPVDILLGKNQAHGGKGHFRPWTHISDLTTKRFNHGRDKLQGGNPPYYSLIDCIIEQLCDEEWSEFSGTCMMGFMRRAISGSEDMGVGLSKQGHTPHVASYHWFGRYGAAIVLECRCPRYRGDTSDVPCCSPDWHVIGTAFFYKPEHLVSHDEDMFEAF